tara:strand:+ start:1488 stop:3809 length:2322 start_codon:yes stop_codon:yes gene_type:complete
MFRQDIYNIITKKETPKNELFKINETRIGGKWYAVGPDAKKVSVFTNQDSYQDHIRNKNYEPYNPQKHSNLDASPNTQNPQGVDVQKKDTVSEPQKTDVKPSTTDTQQPNQSDLQGAAAELSNSLGKDITIDKDNPTVFQLSGEDIIQIDGDDITLIGDISYENNKELIDSVLDYLNDRDSNIPAPSGIYDSESYDERIKHIASSTRSPYDVGGKNKRLSPDANASGDERFTTEDNGIEDEDFDSWRTAEERELPEEQQINVQDLFTKHNIDTSKFPAKYLKVLERMINTKALTKQNTDSISNFIGVAGAGQIQSQVGEIASMIITTIEDDEVADSFAKDLKSQLKDRDKGSNILDPTWIDASMKNRQAAYDHIRENYGEDAKIKFGAWDVKDEVESLGMEDYQKDKGYSTDVYYVVESPNIDENILIEASLKKDGKTYFFNGGTGDILKPKCASMNPKQPSGCSENGWGLNEEDIPEEANPNGFTKKQTKLYMDSKDDLIESVTGGVGVMKRISNEISEAKKELKKTKTKVDKNKIETRIKSLEESKKDIIKVLNETTFKSVREELGVKKVTEKNAEKVAAAVLNLYSDESYFDQKTGARTRKQLNLERINKLSMLVAMRGGEGSAANETFKQMKEEHKQYQLDLSNALLKNEKLNDGLMSVLRDEFPIKSCVLGEEVMFIGDTHLDRKTAVEVFGTDDFDEITDNLTIKEDDDGKVAIIYEAKGTGDIISLAKIDVRQKGVGYSNPPSFNIGIHPEFNTKLEEYRDKIRNN